MVSVARKPVIAFSTCRQNRALYADALGAQAIQWVETFEDAADRLRWWVTPGPVDPGIVALAAQDSWAGLVQLLETRPHTRAS